MDSRPEPRHSRERHSVVAEVTADIAAAKDQPIGHRPLRDHPMRRQLGEDQPIKEELPCSEALPAAVRRGGGAPGERIGGRRLEVECRRDRIHLVSRLAVQQWEAKVGYAALCFVFHCIRTSFHTIE